ncbi:MAG: hypothetical protein OJF52_002851 [Nitrospira sp.]|jgi:phage gpG-like protein|nr:MAG: hypothetical protein OJF52_002851 [Nitrospira sp.]
MIEIKVTGIPEVLLELEQLTPAIRKGLQQGMGRALLRLTRYVKQSKLTGQALHVRTGRLRRSIHSEMQTTPIMIEGTGGTNVKYARAHEFGFDGQVGVKAHLRTIKQAFRRAIAPIQIQVSAHSRHMHLPERSFLRSALKELEQDIRNDLRGGIDDALR